MLSTGTYAEVPESRLQAARCALSNRTERGRTARLARLARRRRKRGVFRSVDDLKAAINRFVAETSADPKPFVWAANPKRVLAAINRGKQVLEFNPLAATALYQRAPRRG